MSTAVAQPDMSTVFHIPQREGSGNPHVDSGTLLASFWVPGSACWDNTLHSLERTTMRLVLFGPPGAGKGTQASLLAKELGLKPISTGALIRDAMRLGTPAGQRARAYVNAGKLVPGEVVRAMAEEAIASNGFNNFILDGYPRTEEQAEWLDAFLATHQAPLTHIIVLQVPEDTIVERLSKRRVHKITGATYHLDFKPPPPDLDPSLIIQRSDDRPDVILKRIEQYHAETRPVQLYYAAKRTITRINGVGAQGAIFRELMHAIQPSAIAA